MSLQRQRDEIEIYFFSAMALQYPDLQITGENADFDPPVDKPWLRISIQVVDQFETCIGGNDNYRTLGAISVQIFTPLSEGSKNATMIADSVTSTFRTATASDMQGIQILRSAVSFSGQSDGYFQVNIFTDYRGQD